VFDGTGLNEPGEPGRLFMDVWQLSLSSPSCRVGFPWLPCNVRLLSVHGFVGTDRTTWSTPIALGRPGAFHRRLAQTKSILTQCLLSIGAYLLSFDPIHGRCLGRTVPR